MFPEQAKFFCGTPYMSKTNSILIFLQKSRVSKVNFVSFLLVKPKALVKPEIIMNLLIKTDKINF